VPTIKKKKVGEKEGDVEHDGAEGGRREREGKPSLFVLLCYSYKYWCQVSNDNFVAVKHRTTARPQLSLYLLHLLERVRLRLDERHAVDGLDLRQELHLGREM
jgi:hypothetical protein